MTDRNENDLEEPLNKGNDENAVENRDRSPSQMKA